jgi:acetyl-CoA C-acetyltransferase
MNNAVILSGVRTPIGSFQGSLSGLTAVELGAHAIRAALERAGVPGSEVEEVLMGCVLTGGQGQAPARQAAKGAGLPDSTPSTTINKVCGSGMKAVTLGHASIALGDAKLVVAGGMESMTNAPYILPSGRGGARMGHVQMLDSMIHDGLWDPYNGVHMGSCGDLCAKEFGYTREAIDEYAARSYHRALAAQAAGIFAQEIAPLSIPQRKGDPLIVAEDEEPRRGNPSKLPDLRPAFGKDGVTTAGNASSINDGAAAMVLADKAFAEAQGLKPLGRIAGWVQHAQDPQWFTTAPAAAVQKLLAKSGLSASDIDIFEINEAFSVVAMHAADQVGIPPDRINVNGGAVSLGHPIGMTGTRLILTALHELRRRGAKWGVASPCIGGGEAVAVLVEAFTE